jgi:RHS repeat-associated protein
MASFTAFLEVGGKKYPLHQYEIEFHQRVDELGRPASRTHGGTIRCVLATPGNADPLLYQWMLDPTMQKDGKLRLLHADSTATLKTISFFNAYCTGLEMRFLPGAAAAGNGPAQSSTRLEVQINPQRVAVGAIVHDNEWPLPSHGAGESFGKPAAENSNVPSKDEEPSGFMEGLHTVLDVVGMIPVIGEAADLVNAGLYVAQGRYGEAALAAASAIPLAGNVVGAAKLARRGAKLIQTAAKVVPPKLLSKLDDGAALAKKMLQKDPIDVATGMVVVQQIDIELPGPIPFVWERLWFSASDHQGTLGYGWHHRYDMGLTLDEATGVVAFRNAEGQHIGFTASAQPGQPVFDRASGLTLHPPAPDDPAGMPWRIWHQAEQVWYVFAQPRTNGIFQPLHAVANTHGQRIELAYEANRLVQITDSAGRLLTLAYNEQGLIARIDGPNPDGTDTPLPLVRYVYNEVGDLIGYTDTAGNQWLHRYGEHLLNQTTSPLGFSIYWEYEGTGTGARCVHTWGDGNLFEGRFTYLDAHTTLLDDVNGQTRYTHDKGLVVRQVDALGYESQWLYNEYSELVAQTDSLGQTTRYTYDEAGNRIMIQQTDGSRFGTAYDDFDRLISYTDELGHSWQYTYNEQGLTASQTDPSGGETRYSYDEYGRLATVINALGLSTQLRYDEQHQLAHIVTPDEQIRSRTYDSLGRIIMLTDPTGAVQQRTYDLTGHLVQVIEPDGSKQQFSYDDEGNLIEAKQGEHVVEFAYTPGGQLAERRQAGQRVAFQYDREGRLTQLLNEANEKYHFELDPLGNVLAEIGFDGLTRRYERDALGRVTRLLRPAGRTTDYRYDEAGQVRSVVHSDGTQVVYSYDDTGALIKAQNNTTTVRFDRDALGRVIREEQGDEWVAYEYDALGQRTSVYSSLGADIQLTFDAGANNTQIKTNHWQVDTEFDQRGLAIQRLVSGGLRTVWQYDALARPTEQRISSGQWQPGRQRTYHWSDTDHLTRLDDSLNGTNVFEYDPLGTLIGTLYGDGSRDVRQADKLGNLYQRSDCSDREYAAGGRLTQSADGTRYRYDEEGNLVGKVQPDKAEWQYAWNHAGQLTSVKRPDGYSVTFEYDALGRRLSKRFRGKTTRWVWMGDKPIHEWAELQVGSGADGVEDVITWLFEEDSLAPVAKLQAGAAYSIVCDHLGTPFSLYDADGNTRWSAQLNAYGELRRLDGKATDCPFRFQGQYEDVETGLYYNRYRYYDPQRGGYISQDPIGIEGGIQLYNYVRNTNAWLDQYGLNPVCRLTGKELAKASDMSILKPGSKEWKKAVEALGKGGKGDLRVANSADAKQLLKEARGNMNRVKRYKTKPMGKGSEPYRKSYEVHKIDPHNRASEVGVGNDLHHIKWRDKDGLDGGHIFFED